MHETSKPWSVISVTSNQCLQRWSNNRSTTYNQFKTKSLRRNFLKWIFRSWWSNELWRIHIQESLKDPNPKPPWWFSMFFVYIPVVLTGVSVETFFYKQMITSSILHINNVTHMMPQFIWHHLGGPHDTRPIQRALYCTAHFIFPSWSLYKVHKVTTLEQTNKYTHEMEFGTCPCPFKSQRVIWSFD